MKHNENTNRDCASALSAFAERQFTHWRGLPEQCRLADVTRLFPLLNDGVGWGRLGQRRADFMMLVVEGYPKPVRVWLEGDRVLMLDAPFPVISTRLTTLLADLGEPHAKLDSSLASLRLEGSQWVYGDRGLALFMNPENYILLRVTVFPPTTLTAYKETLLLDLREKKIPESSW